MAYEAWVGHESRDDGGSAPPTAMIWRRSAGLECSSSTKVVIPPSLRIDAIRGAMPLIFVRSSGGAARAVAVPAAAAVAVRCRDCCVFDAAFSLCFMRPCQSPFAAYEACIGHVETLAGRVIWPA